MKQELARIYRELSAGTLSQPQALQQIRALKQPVRDSALQTRLAASQWQLAASDADTAALTARRVLLCGLDGLDAAALAAQLPGTRCSHVAAAATAQDYAAVALAYFDAVRELLQQRPQRRCCVQLVVADGAEAEVLAGIAGLIETAALENPAVGGQVVLVAADTGIEALAQWLRAEDGAPQNRVVRYREGQRLARRWRFVDEPVAAAPCVFREHGVYLISGGQGGLGLLLAREILRQTGAARVVLSGRREQAGAAVAELLRSGRVSYRQADCADAAQVDALVAAIVREHARLDGIVHSAGILRDDFILKKSPAQFAQVLQPKVAGALNLDRASAALPLDFFLLFSSIAVWAGNLGQADYAAANGFLDEFAGLRQARVGAGLRQGRSLAIAWPHWIAGGMNVDAASLAQLEQRTGLRSMATEAGMRALAQCLSLPQSHLLVLHGKAADLRLDLRAATTAATAPIAVAAASGDDAALRARTREFLRREFAEVLKIAPARIETQAALEQYGIDSILAMNLTTRLEASFGVLAKTLLFEYQNIDELAAYFVRAHAATLAQLFGSAGAAAAKAAAVAPPPAAGGRRQRQRFLPTAATPAQAAPATDVPIAIVGLSGRYPQSRDLAAYWRNLREGRDCIVEVPPERWDWREHYSEDRTRAGAHYSKWGGFIEGVDEFDPRFFNIAPREASSIDPQERLFLQHAWMAVEDAGYTRAALQRPDARGLAGQVGVYAGVMYGEYNLSGSLASIANRVSYFLNLHGPSLTLDTMCSSSLTAIHLACQDLRLGRTSLAIAGGVNVSIHPNKYAMLSGGQFISGEGHCQSFGQGGDGYIPGEGVGVAVLKRLDEAQRDGNVIYGVIRGSALNHGGKTNGYTVPNPQAQAEVIRRALAEAGVDPRDVSYIEAHGTGTKLGDPIEIAALTRAFHEAAGGSVDAGYCRIGSAKSNIGHCESAAGIAGVTKVLLQMRHAAIVPSLHSRTLNPHIDFGATPFVVNQELRHWEAPQRDGRRLPRIAGISSFGAGGSNAHLIIEEYTAAALPAMGGEQLIVLSARTPAQLQQRARDLLDLLDHGEIAPDLAALAWTLQIGREAMEERAGFVAASLDAMRTPLAALARGDAAPGLVRGQVRQHKDAVALLADDAAFQQQLAGWIAAAALLPLLQHWVQGLDLDWRGLPGRDAPPRRISLPTYPFANERYWNAPAATASPPAAVLHPLVHANASTLQQPGYRTRFHGSEAFLQHTPDGRKHLPPLLVLEALRAAVELAAAQRGGEWQLNGVAWGEPVLVSPAQPLQIALLPRAEHAVDVELHDGETVHAQAHAQWQAAAPVAAIDLAALRRALYEDVAAAADPALRYFHGNGQALAELRLPAAAVAAARLPLELLLALERVLQRYSGQPLSPLSLQQLRSVRACTEHVAVWLHADATGRLDIDVVDAQGQVCVQLRGLHGETVQSDAVPAAVATAARVETAAVEHARSADRHAVPAAIASTAAAAVPLRLDAAPREIALAMAAAAPAATFAAVSAKPRAVKLQAAGAVAGETVRRKARVVLTPLAAAEAVPPLRLFELGPGVFALDLQRALEQCLDALPAALRRLRDESSLKVLLLRGAGENGWNGGRAACNAAIANGLLREIAQWPCPVVAVLDQDAGGAGFLLAMVCDVIVCSETGSYGFTDAVAGLLPTEAEIRLLQERLGVALADDLLGRSTRCSGAELRRRGLACRIMPADQVSADSLQLAALLASKPQQALQLLKTHLGRTVLPYVEALTAVGNAAAEQGNSEVLQLALAADADLLVLDAALETALAQAAAVQAVRCIVIAASEGFLAAAADADAIAAVLQRVRRSPVPLLVALPLQVSAAAWLFGLACDAVVYADAGRCSAGELWSEPALAALGRVLCEQRLGAAFGCEVSLCADSYTSEQLLQRVPGAVVAGDTLAAAVQLAAAWKRWPRAQVTAWKQAQCAQLEAAMAALPQDVVDGTAEVPAPAAGPVALPSRVVSVEARSDGVVLVTLHDREAKNLFSAALVEGIKQAFAHIAATPGYKAVVLCGYDSYFATGGTRETLLAIQHGDARFTDETVFQQPMDCALPVIAAIQGHAIGGGWSFGMFSDLVLLSRESRYLSPYMGYGFTPGAGSTLMFPARIGHDLARETLLGAQEISGQELADRGVAVPVLPRRDAVPAALVLAARIARRPRARLLADKRRWIQRLREQREGIYRRELDMHALTFVNNAQTLQTIQAKFGDETAAVPVAAMPPGARPAAAASDIVATIGGMLAQELLLQPGEIDAGTPFIDLGLDSITGVTWIRRINAHYGIGIEATKVYSHPTLNQLARLVAREIAPPSAPSMPTAAPVVPAPVAPPAAAPATAAAADTLAAVTAKIRQLLAGELLLQAGEIDEHTPFIELGLDSITGVTWVRRINQHYGIAIEATKVYSHPTLAEIARLVQREAAAAAARSAPAAPPAVEIGPDASTPAPALPLFAAGARAPLRSWRGASRAAHDATPERAATRHAAAPAIAVVGMAGRFAQARDIDAFWANLAAGRSGITSVADSRWPLHAYYQPGSPAPGKTNSCWLGAVDGHDEFDPLFFNISPAEAEGMEPQQRLFLQACWHSLENAGIDPQSLSSGECGVFVGCGPSDYHQASREQQLSAQGFTGAATSILAARIAYFLDLHGPCLSVDTACSSSLVAIATACDNLNSGSCDLALAGGVYVMAGPAMHIMTAQAGMLSTDGRCYSFDERANGFVPGEGVGVLVLKRLADAQRDGDRIQAVIEGWGVNQDGRTNGITAPNEDAQTRLLQSVYRRFGVDPAGIQLIEAHGTGTRLGDPIEVAGLKAAFRPFTDRAGYCALGSVKSNIGHCLTAAGAAGFIKLVLALQQRQLPPTINYARGNEHIQLAGSPFYVNDRLQPWNVAAGQTRRGAVSSFGFSGTNAHLVVAEYRPPAPKTAPSALTQDGRVIVPLSARTPAQLKQQAQNLLDFIHKATTPPDLLQLAYTLQVGREAMGERLAVMAASVAELAAALRAFLAGEETAGVHHGQVRRHREGLQLISQDEDVRSTLVELWLGQRKLSRLAELWSKGLALDWSRCYGSTRPARIALPGYPFAQDRYWLAAAPVAAPAAAVAAPPPLHVPVAAAPLRVAALPPHDGVSYACDWVEQAPPAAPPPLPRCVLIVRSAAAAFGLEQAIAAHHAAHGARVVPILVGDETRRLGADDFLCGRADGDGFERCLAAVDAVDALYFIAADASEADAASLAHVQASQDSTAIALLRLVKALRRSGRIAARVDTWVLGVDSHCRDPRAARCWGAAAAGLAYSLAQGQHQFRVRNLDLAADELQDADRVASLLAAVMAEPASDRGETIRLQQGRRWRQTFFRLHWDETAPAALKHGGVYVVVGGSGIVGRVLTRQLIARYAAQVVWLGRSAADAPSLQAALAGFDDVRDKLSYLQADALSESSLRAALDQVKQRHGRIHGAIFSGMVFGGDNAIDQIDETDFRRILEVKTLGSQAFHAALRGEPLDFLCFFSSGQAYAFSGAARLPAYASGIVFADSYVRAVRGDSAFPVGSINWGFWKAAVRERIAKLDGVSTRSLDALEDDEGFACFERFVAELQRGRLSQVLCMRASPEVEALMQASQHQCLALAAGGDAGVPPLLPQAIPLAQERIAALAARQAGNGLDGWFARLLHGQLDALRRAPLQLPVTLQALREQCGIVDKYTGWLRQSLVLLGRAGLAEFGADELRRWNAVDATAATAWREQRRRYLDDADTRALTVLTDECLQRLPAILQGRMPATDVIFPQGSMDKVGALYRANAVADTFNEIVADTVLAYVQQRLRHDPAAKLRILEIGAGTGGTSAVVFKRLAGHQAAIAEYCYTDLSKAFFFHAEKHYLADNPYIVCRRLDIEQAIEGQGIEPGSYDLVLSTNALHATRNIRATLRHAKAALRRDGLIVLSEMCDSTLSTHLSFGLLDGWWLFEDAELRIPGCPGLYPQTWQRVLEQEGFDSVLLPGSQARALGSQVVVARSDGLIRRALQAPAASVAMTPQRAAGVAATAIRTASPQDLADPVRDGLLQCLSATLKIAADSIETDIAFSDYGIDSILGVSFIDQINARWGLALNTAVIFEYSSIERLGRHLAESYGRELQAALAATAAAPESAAAETLAAAAATVAPAAPASRGGAATAAALSSATPSTAPIAVIGMSGKFPKADNVEQFWQNLLDGVDGVDELPAHYLDQAAAWSPVKRKGRTRCKWAGILEQRDCFDPLFFSISPKEAEAMNPHQRLVMQESWNALEDAGYDPKSLAGSRTAIFVGAEPAGYVGDSFTGLSDAIIASRLAYTLDLNGPAFVVNTGCSSSAVALHLACESLRNGESDLVLAGGVNACLHQDVLVRLDQIEMLSPSGRCYTFDKAGDGTIISEGVGMVVLKRLDQAIADGDAIYGTICASGINQDGASNGITAPNGAAQEQLIVSTYQRFGIDPERIGYVEAHGTGTKLGDPVETNALVRAFRRYSANSGWCSVGSAKSHIGHAAAAAGVIGLIKVLLSLRHRRLPALLNFSDLNPLIQFEGSPFFITTRNSEWPQIDGQPRLAAINSFGHSGTNAHLVVSEYRPARERLVSAQAAQPLALPLSARTPEQLRQKCEQLLAYVEANTHDIDLRAMACTLQTGREAMEYRCGFAVDSLTALTAALRAHLAGSGVEGRVFTGQARRAGGKHVATAADTASLLLQRWTQGASVAWNGLWPAHERPERQRLPGYPFARERYWIASAFGNHASAAPPSSPPPSGADLPSIEQILDRIADDSIAAEQGVRLLKAIV